MTENPQDPPAQSDQPQQPYAAQPPPPSPPPGQAPAYGQPAQAAVSPSDARMWSLFAHVGGIFFGFIPSLIVYMIYKDRDPFVRRHATQALNFQIIVTIIYVVSVPLMAIGGIGLLTWAAAGIAVLVFSIIAAMAANKGEEYTYPLVPQMVT